MPAHILPRFSRSFAMTVTAQAIPILSDNYAWRLVESGSGAVAVVDPADADAIIAALDAAGGRLDLILLTHHHADHIAGADAVRARFGAPIVGAAADAHRLPTLDQAVREGDTVRFGDAVGQVFETPGHTRGHISFFFPNGAVLLPGDTLFSLGCGRLLEGTAAEMFTSLHKFAALPPETLVCCGHEYTASNARFAVHADPGNAALQARAKAVTALRAAGQATIPSRLGDEWRENPFLLAPDVAAFAELRAAKDRF
jgi:hydroxyacylglutathione hydrolase